MFGIKGGNHVEDTGERICPVQCCPGILLGRFQILPGNVAKECVELGLAQVKPWGHLGDVADAISKHAKENGYSVVREVGGHGIGLEFHETPFVSYVIKKGTGMVMAPGMVFTIEPMINAGYPDVYVDDDNGWTIYTEDDSYSAQWEIMVHVTDDGYEVMTY